MKKLLVGLSIGLLTSASVAQIPMSKFVRTFSSTLTRGYFFQAPVDFEVTSLQVPDEANFGQYMVALYKLQAAPPAWSATVAATPVFWADSVPSHTCVKVPTAAGSFKKGDWVAVMGAAGLVTGGSVRNSYGAAGGANNSSEILGTPIAVGLQRCGMQINLGPTKGVGAMWSEVAGNISRVKMTVKAPGTAGAMGADSCDYCPPSNGNAHLDVCSPNPAIIGKELKLEMKSGGATNTGGVIAFAALKANINVPGFGTLCLLGIQGVVPFGTGPIGNGAVGTTVSLGTIPAATPIGVTVYFQGALATSGATIPLTNGLEVSTGR